MWALQITISTAEFVEIGLRMRVANSFPLVAWVLVVVLPVALLGQTPSAILHTQGGVWVNEYEARDSTAVFPGDVLETRPESSANLTLEGSTVQLQPETVGKFQGDFFALDHGAVAVGTSRSFKVKVNCITVVPVTTDWTQYEVADVNRTVQVAARKNDVRVERESGREKPTAENATARGEIVHEGEQKSYSETEVCGAPPQPTSTRPPLNPKWIGAGAAGAGGLICVIAHCFGGGGTKQVSPSAP